MALREYFDYYEEEEEDEPDLDLEPELESLLCFLPLCLPLRSRFLSRWHPRIGSSPLNGVKGEKGWGGGQLKGIGGGMLKGGGGGLN